MSSPIWTTCTGPIPGLRLPQYAWHRLQDEKITTLDQLKAMADRIEQVVPGIGPKMAVAIRDELARVAASSQAFSDKRQHPGNSSSA